MTTRYRLVTSASRFVVQAFASGMLKAFGHNPTMAVGEFTGELQFDPAAPDDASFQLTVQADSLQVADNVSDSDRRDIEAGMKNDVLEVAKYPEIRFESTDIAVNKISNNWYRLQITGQLSLHGETNEHRVDAQLRIRDGDLRLSGDCTLKQTDYGVKLFTAMGGAMKVKDELEFRFELIAR